MQIAWRIKPKLLQSSIGRLFVHACSDDPGWINRQQNALLRKALTLGRHTFKFRLASMKRHSYTGTTTYLQYRIYIVWRICRWKYHGLVYQIKLRTISVHIRTDDEIAVLPSEPQRFQDLLAVTPSANGSH
jgi:hypothetical protein